MFNLRNKVTYLSLLHIFVVGGQLGCSKSNNQAHSTSTKDVVITILKDSSNNAHYGLDGSEPSFIGFKAKGENFFVAKQLKAGANTLELPINENLKIEARLVLMKQTAGGYQYFVSDSDQSFTLDQQSQNLSLNFAPFAKVVPTNIYGTAIQNGVPARGIEVRIRDPKTETVWDIPELSFVSKTSESGVFSFRYLFTQSQTDQGNNEIVLEFGSKDGKKTEKKFPAPKTFLPGTNLKYINLSGTENIEFGKTQTDFDGDGMTNLAEEAMGTNPFAVNLNGCIPPAQVLKDFSYTCNDGLSLVGTLEMKSGMSCYEALGDVNGDGAINALDCKGEKGNKGDKGEKGDSVGVSLITEPIGANCPTGGSKLSSWIEMGQPNQVIDSAEMSTVQVKYICNGANGVDAAASSQKIYKGANVLGNFLFAGDSFVTFDNANLQLVADSQEVGKFSPRYADTFYTNDDCTGATYISSASTRVGASLSHLVTRDLASTLLPRSVQAFLRNSTCTPIYAGYPSGYGQGGGILQNGTVLLGSGSYYDVADRRIDSGMIISSDGGVNLQVKTKGQLSGIYSTILDYGNEVANFGDAIFLRLKTQEAGQNTIRTQWTTDGNNFENFNFQTLGAQAGEFIDSTNYTCWRFLRKTGVFFAIKSCGSVFSGVFYKSTNNGTSWTTQNLGLGTLPNAYLDSFELVGSDIYLRIGGSVNAYIKSSDSGVTFSLLNPCLSLYTKIVAGGTDLYCLTQDFIHKSVNGGSSWTPVSYLAPIRNLSGFSNAYGIPSRFIKGSGDQLFLKFDNPNIWIVSNNSGVTWQEFGLTESNSYLNEISELLIEGTAWVARSNQNPADIYVTQNSGVSWTKSVLSLNPIGKLILKGGKIFYAVQGTGYAYSSVSSVNFVNIATAPANVSLSDTYHCGVNVCAFSPSSSLLLEIDPAIPSTSTSIQTGDLGTQEGVFLSNLTRDSGGFLVAAGTFNSQTFVAKNVVGNSWQKTARPTCPSYSSNLAITADNSQFFHCGSHSSDLTNWTANADSLPPSKKTRGIANKVYMLDSGSSSKLYTLTSNGKGLLSVNLGTCSGCSYSNLSLSSDSKILLADKISLDAGTTFASFVPNINIVLESLTMLPNGKIFGLGNDRKSFFLSSDNGSNWVSTPYPLLLDAFTSRNLNLPANISLPLDSMSLGN